MHFGAELRTTKVYTMKYAKTLMLIVVCNLGLISYGQQSMTQSTQPATTPSPKETTQSTQEEYVASLDRQVVNASYTYSFISNRLLTDERATQWESRFYEAFPTIQNIEIDTQTQSVLLMLPNSHTNEELLEMVKKFGYTDFEIANP